MPKGSINWNPVKMVTFWEEMNGWAGVREECWIFGRFLFRILPEKRYFFFFFCHCINFNLDRDSRVIDFKLNWFLTPRRHSYSRHNAGNTTLKYILKMIFFALCLHFNSMWWMKKKKKHQMNHISIWHLCGTDRAVCLTPRWCDQQLVLWIELREWPSQGHRIVLITSFRFCWPSFVKEKADNWVLKTQF